MERKILIDGNLWAILCDCVGIANETYVLHDVMRPLR